MAEKRIEIYQQVRDEIHSLRTQNSINSVDLSVSIDKSAGWLSFVENGKIRSILYEDLVCLYMVLLKSDRKSAEAYIKSLYENIEIERIKKENELHYYNNPNDFSDCISIANKIHSDLYRIINANDKKHHKIFNIFSRIERNLSVETTFTLEIISLPIFKLSRLSIKKKQEFLFALNDLIKEFAEGKR